MSFLFHFHDFSTFIYQNRLMIFKFWKESNLNELLTKNSIWDWSFWKAYLLDSKWHQFTFTLLPFTLFYCKCNLQSFTVNTLQIKMKIKLGTKKIVVHCNKHTHTQKKVITRVIQSLTFRCAKCRQQKKVNYTLGFIIYMLSLVSQSTIYVVITYFFFILSHFTSSPPHFQFIMCYDKRTHIVQVYLYQHCQFQFRRAQRTHISITFI